jgi:7-cyano-7-deazaguanine synthase
MKKAVILLSGGLDSATVLAIAKSQGYTCYALSFNYGQKHNAELNAAQKIAITLGVAQHQIAEIDLRIFGGSALTDSKIEVPEVASQKGHIPITYVPARNTIMLSYAVAWAEVLEADDIFIGVNVVDYSSYPDCRPEYIAAFAQMARLATKRGVEGIPLQIQTPLLYLSKAEIIQQGTALGVDYRMTVTCYQADSEGRACGVCEACRLRKAGFIRAGLQDITRYR